MDVDHPYNNFPSNSVREVHRYMLRHYYYYIVLSSNQLGNYSYFNWVHSYILLCTKDALGPTYGKSWLVNDTMITISNQNTIQILQHKNVIVVDYIY